MAGYEFFPFILKKKTTCNRFVVLLFYGIFVKKIGLPTRVHVCMWMFILPPFIYLFVLFSASLLFIQFMFVPNK